MEILPKEVKDVTTVGELHGGEVKMVLTKGGFYIFVGKKEKHSRKAEALTAGSHRAIGLHELEKQYGNDFRLSMKKSEHEQLEKVEDKSCYLSMPLSKNGLELYVLSKNNNLEFVLWKHGITVGKYEAEAADGKLLIKNHSFNKKLYNDTQAKLASEAIASAMKEKMKELNLNKIESKFI